MTSLSKTTPTPTQLADAWVDAFGDAIREGAGADERLTPSEARRIALRDDEGFLASDNAANWLKFSGQKTVGAEPLLRRIHAYVEREATKVAGKNGKVSLKEGKKLPADLRDDFFYLRGKGAPKHRSAKDLAALALDLVTAALDPFTLTKLPGPPSTVRGQRRLAKSAKFPGDPHSQAHIFIGRDDVIYASVGASASSPNLPRVGWYRLGPVPPL